MRVFFGILCVAVYASATQVRQCPNSGRAINDISDRVQIGSCSKPPCRLRRDSVVNVTLKFTPDEDIKNLKTSVSAQILGIPFPFVGVDGVDACNDIHKSDGTKAGCDLKAGEEYLYTSRIEVLHIYPKVKTVVHWGLTDPKGKM